MHILLAQERLSKCLWAQEAGRHVSSQYPQQAIEGPQQQLKMRALESDNPYCAKPCMLMADLIIKCNPKKQNPKANLLIYITLAA